MRLFNDILEAQSEIHRDLYKSPQVYSHHVQHEVHDSIMVEAQNYSYAIMPHGIPIDPNDTMRKVLEKDWSPEDTTQILLWMGSEAHDRYVSDDRGGSAPQDMYHPGLAGMLEGNHFSYTYSERLVGARDCIVAQLDESQTTRRAYWPVFQPQDSIRAISPTRIPCTLGYYFTIREVAGEETPRLNITYISRSCDFGKFWATDLWMANQFKLAVLNDLSLFRGRFYNPGLTSHIVLSFHRFLDDGEETF